MEKKVFEARMKECGVWKERVVMLNTNVVDFSIIRVPCPNYWTLFSVWLVHSNRVGRVDKVQGAECRGRPVPDNY